MNALSWTLMMAQVVWSKYLDHYYVITMITLVGLCLLFGYYLWLA